MVCIKFRHIYTKDTVTYPVKQTNGYVAEIRNSPHSSPLHLCLAALSASLKSTATLTHSRNDGGVDTFFHFCFIENDRWHHHLRQTLDLNEYGSDLSETKQEKFLERCSYLK
jgi:hypothetical protein